jgi:hypothetical protein
LLAEICSWPFVDLSQFVKVKARKTFHISKKPVVPLAEGEQSDTSSNGSELQRIPGPARLVAMARDPWTIFAYWNVDWPSIFKNAAPIDRQVHLRVHCPDGLDEKEAAVEPMAGMHYVKMSQRHRGCRLEIGYYQPSDIWHSVAMSNEITIPPAETSEAEHLDLVTIPFHLRFQQLVDLFGAATQTQLAVVVSQFEKQMFSSDEPSSLSAKQKALLRKLGWSASSIAAARCGFGQTDTDKLARRTAGLLGLVASSPSRGFGDSSWSYGG